VQKLTIQVNLLGVHQQMLKVAGTATPGTYQEQHHQALNSNIYRSFRLKNLKQICNTLNRYKGIIFEQRTFSSNGMALP
jgi:hypothetical protein